MEGEYQEIIKKFYKTYIPIARKYNLTYHMRFDRHESLIEIWELKGESIGKQIIRVKEEEGMECECHKRAIEELEWYKKKREEKEHGRNTAMAI